MQYYELFTTEAQSTQRKNFYPIGRRRSDKRNLCALVVNAGSHV